MAKVPHVCPNPVCELDQRDDKERTRRTEAAMDLYEKFFNPDMQIALCPVCHCSLGFLEPLSQEEQKRWQKKMNKDRAHYQGKVLKAERKTKQAEEEDNLREQESKLTPEAYAGMKKAYEDAETRAAQRFIELNVQEIPDTKAKDEEAAREQLDAAGELYRVHGDASLMKLEDQCVRDSPITRWNETYEQQTASVASDRLYQPMSVEEYLREKNIPK